MDGWAFQVVLQCAVAAEDGVRGKAIRLVANKLFPLPALTPAVESFAREALRRAVPLQRTADGAQAEAQAEVHIRLSQAIRELHQLNTDPGCVTKPD
jgi:hypothetical protein